MFSHHSPRLVNTQSGRTTAKVARPLQLAGLMRRYEIVNVSVAVYVPAGVDVGAVSVSSPLT